MSAFAAIVPFAIFVVIFTVVALRMRRIAPLLRKPARFKAAYMAHLREELRKAGIDPTSVDLDALRAQKSHPAPVTPELQAAVLKAALRTLGGRPPEGDAYPLSAAPTTRTPRAEHAPASAQVMAPAFSSYRPPPIDAQSKAHGRAIVVAVVFLVTAAFALLLRLAA